MLYLWIRVTGLVRSLATAQRAQSTVEYFLVMAVIVTAFVVALVAVFPQLLPPVLGLLCPAIDTAANPGAPNPASAVGDCVGT